MPQCVAPLSHWNQEIMFTAIYFLENYKLISGETKLKKTFLNDFIIMHHLLHYLALHYFISFQMEIWTVMQFIVE